MKVKKIVDEQSTKLQVPACYVRIQNRQCKKHKPKKVLCYLYLFRYLLSSCILPCICIFSLVKEGPLKNSSAEGKPS